MADFAATGCTGSDTSDPQTAGLPRCESKARPFLSLRDYASEAGRIDFPTGRLRTGGHGVSPPDCTSARRASPRHKAPAEHLPTKEKAVKI